MGASHGSTLHQTIFIAGQGTHYLISLAGIASGGRNMHPITIIGVIGTFVVGTHRCDDIHSFIIGAVGLDGIIVTCSKNHQSSGHRADLVAFFIQACIVGKIVDCSLQ